MMEISRTQSEDLPFVIINNQLGKDQLEQKLPRFDLVTCAQLAWKATWITTGFSTWNVTNAGTLSVVVLPDSMIGLPRWGKCVLIES